MLVILNKPLDASRIIYLNTLVLCWQKGYAPLHGITDFAAFVDLRKHSSKKMTYGDSSDELQTSRSQIGSTFKYGNNTSFSKALISAIFIEIKSALLLVIKKVEASLG